MTETETRAPRALFVGIEDEGTGAAEAEALFRELLALGETAGVENAGTERVKLRENHPRYGMGTGKAEEIAEKAKALEADCVIFDREITPSQQRNWETLTGLSVLDRQEVIIRIFALRARTREAEMQARLAELIFSLPRLRHKHLDLSRQRGGSYGTRGAGETRLETDRRLVEARIQRLEAEIDEARKQRRVQRARREKAGLPVIALVGYTNAGKSSLLNALTGAEALAEDRLFATLDVTSRRLALGDGREALLSDTVGFIRRLPHTLIKAFRSTLEEAALADLLIHVVDAADSENRRCYEAAREVLAELGADGIPCITALNKVDRLSPEALAALQGLYPEAVPISCAQGLGLETLKEKAAAALSGQCLSFRFPLTRPDLAALLHRKGRVLSESYEEDHIAVRAWVDQRAAGELREFAE